MADVKPFRGVRFVSASLDEALCPPYDVIPAELARSLRRRPRNSVFLELPQGEGAARYSRAKAVWKKWTTDGTLARDARPAFYVVEETYKLDGRLRVRRGFLVALGATPKAAKAIIPHERTLSKPKADRLRMLNALRVNVSPIFGEHAEDRAHVDAQGVQHPETVGLGLGERALVRDDRLGRLRRRAERDEEASAHA